MIWYLVRNVNIVGSERTLKNAKNMTENPEKDPKNPKRNPENPEMMDEKSVYTLSWHYATVIILSQF